MKFLRIFMFFSVYQTSALLGQKQRSQRENRQGGWPFVPFSFPSLRCCCCCFTFFFVVVGLVAVKNYQAEMRLQGRSAQGVFRFSQQRKSEKRVLRTGASDKPTD